MSVDYAWEKLHVAVLVMARGSGSLQERLVDAFLSFHPIRPDEDLPAGLRPAYEAIVERLTEVEPRGDEGQVQATARAMGEADARQLIEDIVSLYDHVARRMPSE